MLYIFKIIYGFKIKLSVNKNFGNTFMIIIPKNTYHRQHNYILNKSVCKSSTTNL